MPSKDLLSSSPTTKDPTTKKAFRRKKEYTAVRWLRGPRVVRKSDEKGQERPQGTCFLHSHVEKTEKELTPDS